MKHLLGLVIVTVLLCASATVSANPVNVNPAGTAQSYTFFLIAAGTIAIETMILCLISRIFHHSICDLGMKFSLIALNIVTLLVVLMPLKSLTNSILIAELAVVVIEAFGILKIFESNGIKISNNLALIYSISVNFVSYTIGALCQ